MLAIISLTCVNMTHSSFSCKTSRYTWVKVLGFTVHQKCLAGGRGRGRVTTCWRPTPHILAHFGDNSFDVCRRQAVKTGRSLQVTASTRQVSCHSVYATHSLSVSFIVRSFDLACPGVAPFQIANYTADSRLCDGRRWQRSELMCLRREVQRMSQLECECAQKDDLIQQLREEVTNLQHFVRHIELERCPSCQQLPSVCRPAPAAAAGDVTSSVQVSN